MGATLTLCHTRPLTGHRVRRSPYRSAARGETFVTRKITRSLANISQGLEECLSIGNMNALRDWGHAKDYVRMQWMMLQQEEPKDYVIATGVQYSVRQFIEKAAQQLGVPRRLLLAETHILKQQTRKQHQERY